MRVKPFAVIKAQCAVAGVAVDDYAYRTQGFNYVCLGRTDLDRSRPGGTPFVSLRNAYVMFNTSNGNFHGRTETGVWFNSKSAMHEGEPWFQALLSFFYEEG